MCKTPETNPNCTRHGYAYIYAPTKTWNPETDDTTVCNFCAVLQRLQVPIDGKLFDIKDEPMMGTLFVRYNDKDIWATPNWENENIPGISVAICDEDGGPFDFGYIPVAWTGDCTKDAATYLQTLVDYIQRNKKFLK